MRDPAAALARTPLDDLHRAAGARMVAFAGYAMPVQYPDGILKEHLHTRRAASLFDVSHMGQIRLTAAQGVDAVCRALETLMPADLLSLTPGRQRYGFFTDDAAGILDDLMVTHGGDHLHLVVNAARKHDDLAHLTRRLAGVVVTPRFDRALLALQGPHSESVLAPLAPGAAALYFMEGAAMDVAGASAFVTRSGYTGEDGFEISVAAADAPRVATALLASGVARWAGLGARDSLRLEAGLCLYGHDIDTATTPVEAGLVWAIGPRRRAEGGYPGSAIVAAQLRDGAPRRRVGLRPDGRAPARERAEIRDVSGRPVGRVTSGTFAPSLEAPVAMGYIERGYFERGAGPSASLVVMVRDKPVRAALAPLPFVTPGFKRRPKP